MLNVKRFLNSRTGVVIMSIVLGLGLSTLFKMSCDNRSCLVYEAPDFSEKKIMKYNDKCYQPEEHMQSCDATKTIINI